MFKNSFKHNFRYSKFFKKKKIEKEKEKNL